MPKIKLSDIPVSILFEETEFRWNIDKEKAKKVLPQVVGAAGAVGGFFTPLPGGLAAGYAVGRKGGQLLANKLFSDNYEIAKSQIHGRGIIAKKAIPKGTNLGIAFEKIKKTGDPDKDYARTDLGEYVNHSDKPNMRIVEKDNKVYYITTQSVTKGQELFVNYRTFSWEGKQTFEPDQQYFGMDGKAYDVQKLWKLTANLKSYPLDWNSLLWRTEKKIVGRDIMKTPMYNEKLRRSKDRIASADLSYPILTFQVSDKYRIVIDGVHRIFRALKDKQPIYEIVVPPEILRKALVRG